MLLTAANSSPPRASAMRQEAACWATGAAFTFVLFFGMARLENLGATASAAMDIQDVPLVSLPLEIQPPPQRSAEPTQADEALPALTGLDLENTGSPIKIAVMPPDLQALVPDQRAPMPALVSIGRFSATVRPQVGVEKVDVRRVYQATEVDQQPTALERIIPPLSAAMYTWGRALSVTLLIRIDTEGRVEDTRILLSSGHEEFDTVIGEAVRGKWLFSPAIKRGHKVRCLVQQKITVVLESRSAFGVH